MALRDDLRDRLRVALRERDRDTTATLRSALAAIDNAEAVPAPERSTTVVIGAGAAEVARRELTEDDVRMVVEAEAEECRSAAAIVRARDPERARGLERQAEVLEGLLGG
jgi:uncharacterized protein